MDIFERIGEKLTKTGKNVVQGTKNFTHINKLNNQISEIEQEISNSFQAIGQLYYQEHREDFMSEDPKYKDFIAKINHLYSEIDRNNAEIKRIKEAKSCPKCGSELEDGAKFCDNCGTRIEQGQEQNGVMHTGGMNPQANPSPIPEPDNETANKTELMQESGTYYNPETENKTDSVQESTETKTAEAATTGAPVKPIIDQANSSVSSPEYRDPSEVSAIPENEAQKPNKDSKPAVCPSCNASLNPGDAFCTNCGAKL